MQTRPFKAAKSLVMTTAGGLFGSSSAPPGASVAVIVTQAREGQGDVGEGGEVRRAGAFDMQLVTVETIRTRSPPPPSPTSPFCFYLLHPSLTVLLSPLVWRGWGGVGVGPGTSGFPRVSVCPALLFPGQRVRCFPARRCVGERCAGDA